MPPGLSRGERIGCPECFRATSSTVHISPKQQKEHEFLKTCKQYKNSSLTLQTLQQDYVLIAATLETFWWLPDGLHARTIAPRHADVCTSVSMLRVYSSPLASKKCLGRGGGSGPACIGLVTAGVRDGGESNRSRAPLTKEAFVQK